MEPNLNASEQAKLDAIRTKFAESFARKEIEKELQALQRQVAELRVAPGLLHPDNAGSVPKRKASICKLLMLSSGVRMSERIDAGYEKELFPGLQQKALSAGTDASGGFLAPEQFNERLIEAVTAFVAVRAAQARDGGSPFPMSSDTLKTARGSGSVGADWVAESIDAVLSDPGTEQVTLSLKDLIAATQISNKLIEVANPAADEFVERRLIRAIVEKESIDFLRRAAGGSGPTGIANIAGVQTFLIAAGAAGAIALVDLEKAEGLLIDAGFAPPFQWLGNSKIYRKIAALKDADGRRLFEPPTLVQQAGPLVEQLFSGATRAAMGRIQPLGYEFLFESQIPSNLGVGTNETELYLVKGREIMIGDNSAGVVLAASNQFKFLADATVIRATKRTDINMEHAAALVKVTGANAT